MFQGANGSKRAQAIFNGVSEVMHFISHVYHAISDFNFFLNRPPPRFLQLNSYDSIPHNYLTNYTSAILPPSSTQRHVSTQTTSTNQSTYVPGVDCKLYLIVYLKKKFDYDSKLKCSSTKSKRRIS